MRPYHMCQTRFCTFIIMITEVEITARYLTKLVFASRQQKDPSAEKVFFDSVKQRLLEKCKAYHWSVEQPLFNNANRCIMHNMHWTDPALIGAAKDAGISNLNNRLPIELTLWIDPGSVTVRFGEHGQGSDVYNSAMTHDTIKTAGTKKPLLTSEKTGDPSKNKTLIQKRGRKELEKFGNELLEVRA